MPKPIATVATYNVQTSGAAPRAAAAMAVMKNPPIATRSTPSRAISSEPGTAASANMVSGMPISAPTCVSLMCRSSWISGRIGGTTSSGSRMATPASQSRARMMKSAAWRPGAS